MYVVLGLDGLQEKLYLVYFLTTRQQIGHKKGVIHVYLFHGRGSDVAQINSQE
jgi:hypothetical protein